MNPGDLVVVHCGSPKEKFWGELLALTAVGVTLRALPLEAFEDFLRQCASGAQKLLGAVTIFLPAHRIERIELDETAGVAEGLAVRFRRLTGRDPREALSGEGHERNEDPPHN
jgi:hypothetical protein